MQPGGRSLAVRSVLTELLRRMPGPPPERACEVGVVRVTEIEGDVQDLAVGFFQQCGGDGTARSRQQLLVGEAGLGEPSLESADARADRGCRRLDAGKAVARQRLDDLADRPHEIEGRRRLVPAVDLGGRRRRVRGQPRGEQVARNRDARDRPFERDGCVRETLDAGEAFGPARLALDPRGRQVGPTARRTMATIRPIA